MPTNGRTLIKVRTRFDKIKPKINILFETVNDVEDFINELKSKKMIEEINNGRDYAMSLIISEIEKYNSFLVDIKTQKNFLNKKL